MAIRYLNYDDSINAVYGDYQVNRKKAASPKKPAFPGNGTKQKLKATVASAHIANPDAPGAADASESGDDEGDDGDGDGDGDGPRRPSHPRSSLPPCSPSRARRRPEIPRPLTRRAFALLLTLALLLAYIGPPGFAVIFIQLGHPELASEMLRYKPVLLLPTPPGWSAAGEWSKADPGSTSPPRTRSALTNSPTIALPSRSSTPTSNAGRCSVCASTSIQWPGRAHAHKLARPRQVPSQERTAWSRPASECSSHSVKPG
jgi:hypothetical protein